MTNDLRITSNHLASLTREETDALWNMLNTGDRGGFYMSYYAMTDSDEAELQARVATFSGPVGHAVFAANRLLQEAFGPGFYSQRPEYKGIYFISQLIASRGLELIDADASTGSTARRAE